MFTHRLRPFFLLLRLRALQTFPAFKDFVGIHALGVGFSAELCPEADSRGVALRKTVSALNSGKFLRTGFTG